MNFFGKCFVRFFSNFGYDKMLKATGRYYCDFLQSVDNIHLQMRFTYPKMKSPSMQLTQTDENGAVLVYRSTRTGFSQWVFQNSIQFLGKKSKYFLVLRFAAISWDNCVKLRPFSTNWKIWRLKFLRVSTINLALPIRWQWKRKRLLLNIDLILIIETT